MTPDKAHESAAERLEAQKPVRLRKWTSDGSEVKIELTAPESGARLEAAIHAFVHALEGSAPDTERTELLARVERVLDHMIETRPQRTSEHFDIWFDAHAESLRAALTGGSNAR